MALNNVRLLAENRIDDATLTAIPAFTASLPITRAQQSGRAVARSTGLGTQVIWGNLDNQYSINTLAFSRHNLTGAATVRLKLWDNYDRSGTLVLDTGNITTGQAMQAWGDWNWGEVPIDLDDFHARCFSHDFTAVSASSFEITLTDEANTDGYFEFARIVLGQSWSPTYNMSYGVAIHWLDSGSQSRTEGGSLRSEPRAQYRRWSFSLDALSAAERGELMDELRRAGLSREVFINCYPGAGGALERDGKGLAKLTQMPSAQHAHLNLFTTQLVLEET